MSNVSNSIKNICRTEYKSFLKKPNVVGIALGNKITNGIDTGEACIHVLVSKKIPATSLSTAALITPTYSGFKTDVIETGEIKAQALIARIRPILFGYSVGPYNISLAGTAGCLVTDGRYYYILSNNHVLAAENKVSIGTSILQPARFDGGKYPTDSVASLYKFIKINFKTNTTTPTNYVDCALAYIPNISQFSSKIAKLNTGVKGITNPTINLPVQKVGRTTELTTGTITSTNATVTVGYSSGNAVFVNQIVTTGMSSGGDSGSLLLDNNYNAVGLLFAGSNTITVFNPISTVLNNLGVKLVLS